MTVMMDLLRTTVERTTEPLRTQRAEQARQHGEQQQQQARSNPARTFQQRLGALLGVLNSPVELANAVIAGAGATSAPGMPSIGVALPAVTLGSTYFGSPHGHIHPPSLIPPNPIPIPLPSAGTVLLGTCVQVWIRGAPAARAGDLGFAPTCVGFVPAFEIATGSSKVFIGGTRAARMTDLARACAPGVGGPMRGVAMAMAVAGHVAAVAGVVADAIDAEQSSMAGEADMAAASALSAAMNAAQMAADLVAMAISTAMGTDIAVPPLPGAMLSAKVTARIGGMPVPNIPNPLVMMLERLRMRVARGWRQRRGLPESDSHTGTSSCPARR